MARHDQSFPTDREAAVLRIMRRIAVTTPLISRRDILGHMPVKRQHEWLTSVIDSLENRRLIERQLRPNSSTNYHYSLTPRGSICAEAAETLDIR